MNSKKIIIIIFIIIVIFTYLDGEDSSNDIATQELTPSPTVEDDNLNYNDHDFIEDYDDSESSSQGSQITITNFYKRPKFTAKKNSTEMVEQIARTAKANIDSFSTKDANKIIETIQKANHNYYTDNTTMERFMWYGYLLDYKYPDNDARSELGTDLYQAIKYVYRGMESVSDSSTRENWSQIDKDLARISQKNPDTLIRYRDSLLVRYFLFVFQNTITNYNSIHRSFS